MSTWLGGNVYGLSVTKMTLNPISQSINHSVIQSIDGIYQLDGLMKIRRNSGALALELRFSCINSLNCLKQECGILFANALEILQSCTNPYTCIYICVEFTYQLVNTNHTTLTQCGLVNSLRPSDTIWRHRSGSTLVQVMACCLTAPSHYLNQCWLISEVQWQFHKRYLRHESPELYWKLLI